MMGYVSFKKYIFVVLSVIIGLQCIDLILWNNLYFFELMFWFFWIFFFFDVGCFVGCRFIDCMEQMSSIRVSWCTYQRLWSLLVDDDECFDDLIVRLLDCKE